MRSNKFISMLAVAAVMVGCSQEELAVVDNQQLDNNLANRPVVGNVEIGLGVESRMALKDGSALNLAYEVGDKVGAALIDVAMTTSVPGKTVGSTDYSGYSWNYDQYLVNTNHGTSQNPVYYTTAGLKSKDFYSTVEYISSNYPYTRNEDGSFESEANLLEGNYMFYMPYNAKHLNRKAIEVVLPQIQDCSDEVMRETTWKSNEKIEASSTVLGQFYAGTMEGFEGAPVLLGYKFLEAPKDGSLIKPSVEMNHLFAYPMITIKNDFNGFFYGSSTKATAATRATATMIVDSIQVYYKGSSTNPLFYKKPVNSANIATELATDGDWEEAKLQTGGLTASVLGDETTATFNHANVGTDVTKVANAQIAPETKRVTMVIGKELAYGDSYSFHSILPAGNYGDDLTARVYVTIGSKRYVIINAENNVTYNAQGVATRCDYVTDSNEDYTFVSRGGNGLELVRGEHFPKAEINVDENGNKSRKAFAGEAMTISFAGTVDVNGDYAGGTAFELSTQTITNYYGITSNADFISYLNDWVGRGKTLVETTSNATVARANWAEGEFAFHPQNTVVINAELIKGLKKHTDKGEDIAKLVLATNMPIANDVKITNVTSGVYTFETLDADKVSYKIDMTGVTFHSNAAELKAGINEIAGGELKTKAGQSNIVVVLNGNSTVTTNTTNVSSIYVESGILTVNAACSAMVVAEAGQIVIGANGSLTNANNVLKNITVTNNSAREIAGTLTDVTVAITYDAAWPTTAIPANSKINNVTINTASGINEMVIEQAQINMFSALTNVNVVLGTNITKIKSTANVTLTNVKSITATSAAQWYSTNNGVIITKYQWGNSTQKTTVGNISAGAGITIQ